MYLSFEMLIVCILTLIASVCLVLLLIPQIKGRGRGKTGGFGSVVRFPESAPVRPSVGDPASQLRHVMAASFYKKKVMNREEYKVFKVVETEVLARRNGCRVLSQTSLGEIIGSDNKLAFDSINSKRVDILIIGPYGEPVAVIEYQGSGHHQGTAAARDAIKKEALRKAGVQFVEVQENHSPDEIALLVRKIFIPLETVNARSGAQHAV